MMHLKQNLQIKYKTTAASINIILQQKNVTLSPLLLKGTFYNKRINMDNILKTDTLQLRPINRDDAHQIFEYRSDVENNKYQDFIPSKIKDIYEFIEDSAEEMNEVGTWFQLVIIHSESEKIIGDIGLNFLDEDQVEINITLSKDFQNKSYATEALSTIIDLLFTQLKKHRIIASTDPRNEAIIRLLSRLKFRKEAHFKESYFSNGEWLDDVQFGLLSSEWEGL